MATFASGFEAANGMRVGVVRLGPRSGVHETVTLTVTDTANDAAFTVDLDADQVATLQTMLNDAATWDPKKKDQ